MNTTQTDTGRVTANGTRWKATNDRGFSSFFDTEEQGWTWVRTGVRTGTDRVVMTTGGGTRSRGSRRMRWTD